MIDAVKFGLLLLLLLLGGCASTGPVSVANLESEIIVPPPPSRTSGSLYLGDYYEVGLYTDERAHRIGDLLTVMLNERTNASKSARTTTAKENAFSIENPTLFGLPLTRGGATLETGLSSSKEFTGEGDSEQSNSLTGSITVVVREVLTNGYLRVSGEKIISINQGDEYVRLSGIVRPSDISAANTVSSHLIANAKISYGGSGVISSSNQMGWLAKFFNSGWWPF